MRFPLLKCNLTTPYPWRYSHTPFPQHQPQKPPNSPLNQTLAVKKIAKDLFTNSDSVTEFFQEEILNIAQLQNRIIAPQQKVDVVESKIFENTTTM